MTRVGTKLWAAVELQSGVHVMPIHDLVEHDEHDCVCVPTDDPVHLDNGSIAWVTVHHSLDGREHHE